jgi:hypothetical protein
MLAHLLLLLLANSCTRAIVLPLPLLLMAASASATPAASTVLLLATPMKAPAASIPMPGATTAAVPHCMPVKWIVAAQHLKYRSYATDPVKCDSVKQVL